MIAVDYKFAAKCVIKSKTWFNIGRLIYLISKGSNDGYKLWLKYSGFSKNYDPQDLGSAERHCYDLWSNFDELMPEDFDPQEMEDLPEGW